MLMSACPPPEVLMLRWTPDNACEIVCGLLSAVKSKPRTSTSVLEMGEKADVP